MGLSDVEVGLVGLAKEVADKARVHLSGYRVGAAILSGSGEVYVGCNVEFDNYSNTIHAEESAISAFVAAGESKMRKVVVFTFGESVAYPCGMCRQSLFELGGYELEVISCKEKVVERRSMRDLIPEAF